MNDQKANAAYHPGTGPEPKTATDPTPEARTKVQEQADTYALQAEAEHDETMHDLDVAAQNQRIIDELRELYSFESFEADARKIIALDGDGREEALTIELTAARGNRTRELLGVPIPTSEQVIQMGMRLMAERARDEAAEAGA